MHNHWEQFGFRSTPYRFTPLEANEEDFSLHVGRNHESAQFLTQVDQGRGGIIIISGDIGLGKTSFLNVQQHLLYTGKGSVGPHLLINRVLTSIARTDTIDVLAQRIVHNMISGIEAECAHQTIKLPQHTAQIKKWMSHEGKAAGLAFGFQALSFGMSVQRTLSVPPVSAARLENWKDILEVLVEESKHTFKLDGALLCIDNTETLPVKELTEILMFYRDTLFSINDVCWVIVGQRGLYGQIDSVDRRVSQRIRGTGIEIEPLSSEDLHAMVEIRIQNLRIQKRKSDGSAKSPLSKSIHELLYEASCGQPRYMLKTADTLFGDIIATMRMKVSEQLASQKKPPIGAPEFVQRMISETIQNNLVDQEVPNVLAESLLKSGVVKALKGRNMPPTHLEALRHLGAEQSKHTGTSGARADRQIAKLDPEVLTALENADLLFKIEESERAIYRLKGDAWLCNHYGGWDDVAKSSRAAKAK